MPRNGLQETITHDNLIAGPAHRVVESATILSGQGVLLRGTCLGKVTASGNLKKVDSAGGETDDGSRKIWAVLADDVDATSADAVTSVYLTGEFNTAALIFGGTDTAATHKDEARRVGIFFKTNQPAV